MTEQEIDAMEAGRELDHIIAEDIFGLNVFREQTDGRLYVGTSQFRHEWQELPRYSTDIGAAWLVVEKMRELGFPIHIQCFQNPGNRYGVAGYRDLRTDAWIWAQTAPLAICRAALKAADCHEITTNEADEPTEKTG